MRKLYLLCMMVLVAVAAKTQDTITQTVEGMTDSRDGHFYKTVRIGNQVWMAENLAYMPKVSLAKTQGGIWVYNHDGTSPATARELDAYKLHGCLYDWATAVANTHGNGKDICPKGWHLPSDQEWKELETTLGMAPPDVDTIATRITGMVGKHLKNSSGWDDNGGGDNSSGFAALPSGCRNSAGYFINLGRAAAFWTSTGVSETNAWNRILLFNSTGVDRMEWSKQNGRSVRCIKD